MRILVLINDMNQIQLIDFDQFFNRNLTRLSRLIRYYVLNNNFIGYIQKL
jgi:hypothetical protein